MTYERKRLRAAEVAIQRNYLGSTLQEIDYDLQLRVEGQFCKDQLKMLKTLCEKSKLGKEDRNVFARILSNCFEEEVLVRLSIV
jgi:hypothetical protein